MIAGWRGFFVMAFELLSGRVLAPNFGSSIYVWGGVITIFMLALSIGYLLGGRLSTRNPTLRKLAAILLLAAVATLPLVIAGHLALCLRGEDAASETVIHSERSLYRNITVYEENGERCMKFSRLYAGNRQSCVLLRDPARLIFAYTKMMLASLYLAPRPTKVLILGLGGGTLPAALIRIFPDIEMDVVEVDAAVIRVARQYFDFH